MQDLKTQTDSSPKISKLDQEQINRFSRLVEFNQSEVWLQILKPFLMDLAQSGYPVPQKFKTYEEMLPSYTFALGGTEKIRQFIQMVESAQEAIEAIKKKYADREANEI